MIAKETADDVYQNTIRLVPVKFQPPHEFHANLKVNGPKIMDRLRDLASMRTGPTHCDLVFKSMLEPKKKADEVRQLLLNLQLADTYRTLPPCRPETNVLKLMARCAYNGVRDAIAMAREDQDNRLPPCMQIKTNSDFSLKEGSQFCTIECQDTVIIHLCATLSDASVSFSIAHETKLLEMDKVTAVKVTGAAIAQSVRSRWHHPFRWQEVHIVKNALERVSPPKGKGKGKGKDKK
jgi:hypothetical protein